jgi:hypothetical protein
MPQIGGKNAKKTSSNSKRHFTVVMENKENGLYISSSPSSAAKKAVTKLCTSNKSKKVEFHIREITQGSKKKTYGPYTGYIEKLKEPIELKGRVIRYKPVAKLSGKTGKKMKGGEPNNEKTAYSFNNLSNESGKISNNAQNKSKEIIKESMSELNKAKQEQTNATKKSNESKTKANEQKEKANETRRQYNENKKKANNLQLIANELRKKSLESTGRFQKLEAKYPNKKINNKAANSGGAAAAVAVNSAVKSN